MRAVLLVAAFVGSVLPAIAQWKLDDSFKAAKAEDLKDIESKAAPKDAIVLFDGKSLDNWVKTDGKGKPGWKLVDGGAMEGVTGEGDLMTKDTFDGKFTLHVEFRIPYEPKLQQGQGRGNSGVYIQGRYEVQVLDSYGLKSGKNDCAAIYDIHPPKENACKAPTVWQSYDIEFASPEFDDAGKKKLKPVVMSVTHNGVKVHDGAKVEKDNTTAGLGGDPAKPGPILLQDHGHTVQYRNIWLLPAK